MFKSNLKLEAKKIFIQRNLILLGVVTVISILFSLDGILDYNKFLNSREPFQKMEQEKVKMHVHYTAYGTRGVRIMFLPAPLSVLFNDAVVFNGMTAHVDTAEKLNIDNTLKGSELFSTTGGYMDFSGVLLLMAAGLALFYGSEAIRDRDYIGMAGTLCNSRNPMFFVILARAILTAFFFLAVSVFSLLWLLINGINALNVYYFLFILVLLLITVFFTFSGAVIGSIKHRQGRALALPVFYLVMVLFIPWMVQKLVYIEAKNGIEAIYNFEYQTFEQIMKLEQRSFKEIGTWKSGKVAPEKVKAIVRSGQEREYKTLKKLEKHRFDDIVSRIRTYQTVAAIFPTSFYISMNRELSSKGFQDFLKFYRYAYDKKEEFIRFYIERKFYMPLPESGVEPFFTSNENLYLGESQLPRNMGQGLAVLIIWIGVAAALVWFFYDRPHPRSEILQDKESDVKLRLNKTTVIITKNPDRCPNLLERLRLQGFRILSVPDWHTLPRDVKVSWFFQLFDLPVPEKLQAVADHYSHTLEPDQKAMILTEIIRTYDPEYFVFNDFLLGLSESYMEYFVGLLKALKKGRKVVYFSSSLAISSKIADHVTRYAEERLLY